MAMIKCPECGKEISDQSKQCVYCGCPIKGETQKESNLGLLFYVLPSLICLLSLLCLPFATTNYFITKDLDFWDTLHFIGENGYPSSAIMIEFAFFGAIGAFFEDLIIFIGGLANKETDFERTIKKIFSVGNTVLLSVVTLGAFVIGTVTGFEDLTPSSGWVVFLLGSIFWCGLHLAVAYKFKTQSGDLNSTPAIDQKAQKRRVCTSCGYVGEEDVCPQCGKNHWVTEINILKSRPAFNSCDRCGEKASIVTDVTVGRGDGENVLHLCKNCAAIYDIREPFRTDFDPTGINEYTLTSWQKDSIADQKNSELIDCLFDTDYTIEYRCQCYRELQKRGMILPNA